MDDDLDTPLVSAPGTAADDPRSPAVAKEKDAWGFRKPFRTRAVVLIAVASAVYLARTFAGPSTDREYEPNGPELYSDPHDLNYDHATDGEHNATEADEGRAFNEDAEESKLHTAPLSVLYAWLAPLIGTVVYFLISRFAHGVPYTAVMFSIGTIVGYSIQKMHEDDPNDVIYSALQWEGINGEVILLVFLPGLLYLDAYNVDTHLFMQSFWQLITFAFPMVLAGTALTALVAKYILPYDWTFDFCMMFGAILAATDPVAVAVLLNELGAPPRLKVHIAGESLLNDGSAFVFYYIFKKRFLVQLGIPDLGVDVGWGQGFVLFTRLAFGGAAIGFAFGIGQVGLLFLLRRRLSKEENVVQVASTITTAYLVFFTSEIIAECSGIVAVVVCGITVKIFGEKLHNNSHLTHDFWHIIEHLLNTLLFTLAGTVWGGVLSDNRDTDGIQDLFKPAGCCWLVLLFLLLIVIRFFLTFSFFPLTSRLGIGQSWQEAVFMSYGGLRGAVGIALALSLSAEVFAETGGAGYDEEKKRLYRDQVAKLFALVGGIAFLTLVVNGPTAGPLLKRLGLNTPTEARNKIVKNYERHMEHNTLMEFLSILSNPRFRNVEYDVVKRYVSPLCRITQSRLDAALKVFNKRNPEKTPNLENLVPYVSDPSGKELNATPIDGGDGSAGFPAAEHRGNYYDLQEKVDEGVKNEERHIFISLLRREYDYQIETGELESRGFVSYSLRKGLDIAKDAATKDQPLNDWEASQSISVTFAIASASAIHSINLFRKGMFGKGRGSDKTRFRIKVLQALVFIHAHEAAAKIFKEQFASIGSDSITASEKVILDESKEEIKAAEASLEALDAINVDMVKSQYVCKILLIKSANYFEDLSHFGLMTEKEASELLANLENEMSYLLVADELESVGVLDTAMNVEDTWLEITQEGDSTTKTSVGDALGETTQKGYSALLV